MTKLRILQAAISLAREGGFSKVTRDNVALAAGVATGLLYHYYDSIDDVKSKVLEVAIEAEDAELLKCGIVAAHPTALGAPDELKKRALELLAEQVIGR
jgi:AcrR family transcriptional regulator